MNNINYCNCVYYKSTGAPFGGCKHPDSKTACIYGCQHYASRNTKDGKEIIKKRRRL